MTPSGFSHLRFDQHRIKFQLIDLFHVQIDDLRYLWTFQLGNRGNRRFNLLRLYSTGVKSEEVHIAGSSELV